MENVLTTKVMDELILEGCDKNPELTKPSAEARDRTGSNYSSSGYISRSIMDDYSSIEPAKLRHFLEDYHVPIFTGVRTAGKRTIYYTPCPFRADHTVEIAATDAHISVCEDGQWAYGCFHEHCNHKKTGRLSLAKKNGKSAWSVFKEAVTCPVRMGLKGIGVTPSKVTHEDKARFYYNVVCPRNNLHRGTAIYRKADYLCTFVCNEEGCDPILWTEFMSTHREMGVAV